MRRCTDRDIRQVAENVIELTAFFDHMRQGFHAIANYDL